MCKLLSLLAAFVATAALAFDPPSNTNTYTSSGITYSQKGGVPNSSYVVTAVDVGAIRSSVPVQSVNSKTGAVELAASDVGAIPSTSGHHQLPPGSTIDFVGQTTGSGVAGGPRVINSSLYPEDNYTAYLYNGVAKHRTAGTEDYLYDSSANGIVRRKDLDFSTNNLELVETIGVTSPPAPVRSVNSKTGEVTLSASDVGAFPATAENSGFSTTYGASTELHWARTVLGTNQAVYAEKAGVGVRSQVGSSFIDEFYMNPLMPGRLTRVLYDGTLNTYNYDFPRASGTVAFASDVAAKQDRLPYPTNAIPYSALSGAPSESDPTVPAWAKEDTKPEYAMSEIIDHDYIPASWIMNAPWLGRAGGTMTGDLNMQTNRLSFNGGRFSMSGATSGFVGPSAFMVMSPYSLRLWDPDGTAGATNYWDGCFYETMPEYLARVIPLTVTNATSGGWVTTSLTVIASGEDRSDEWYVDIAGDGIEWYGGTWYAYARLRNGTGGRISLEGPGSQGATSVELTGSTGPLVSFHAELDYLPSVNSLGLARLVDLPTVPTKTSQLTNDSGFLTASGIAGKQDVLPYPTNAIPYAVIVGAPSLDEGRVAEIATNVVDAKSGTITSNVVTKAYVESLGISGGGAEVEDPVRDCTWVQCCTNGVFYWIVKEE